MDGPDPRTQGKEGIERALQYVEKLRRQADETLRQYQEAREEAGALTSEGHSSDGVIKAVLDDNGHVTELVIPDYATRELSRLGGSIVEAIHEAQAAHSVKMAELAQKMDQNIDVMAMVREAMPASMRENLDRRERGW